MSKTILLLTALIAGGVIPLQGAINSHAGRLLKHPLQATFINFAGGLVTLLVLFLILRPSLPTRAEVGAMPWYLFTGGILGVIFVTSIVTLMPKLGAATVLSAAIAGQLVISVVFDHNALLGVPHQPATAQRIIGVLLLFAGLYLIQLKPAPRPAAAATGSGHAAANAAPSQHRE